MEADLSKCGKAFSTFPAIASDLSAKELVSGGKHDTVTELPNGEKKTVMINFAGGTFRKYPNILPW